MGWSITTTYFIRFNDRGTIERIEFDTVADRNNWEDYARKMADRRPGHYTNITTGTITRIDTYKALSEDKMVRNMHLDDSLY